MYQQAQVIPTNTARVVAGVAGAALHEVVRSTPVDTGLARSNWIVSLNAPSLAKVAPHNPYPKFSGPKVGETANADAAIQIGVGVISGFRSGAIFIQNNLDYIAELNDGSSNQAPALFVQKAVKVGVFFVTNGNLKVLGTSGAALNVAVQ